MIPSVCEARLLVRLLTMASGFPSLSWCECSNTPENTPPLRFSLALALFYSCFLHRGWSPLIHPTPLRDFSPLPMEYLILWHVVSNSGGDVRAGLEALGAQRQTKPDSSHDNADAGKADAANIVLLKEYHSPATSEPSEFLVRFIIYTVQFRKKKTCRISKVWRNITNTEEI